VKRVIPGWSLAKIGNASRTMRKDGEVLERGVFDLEARRKPQGFAAVLINTCIWNFNSLFLDLAALRFRFPTQPEKPSAPEN